MADGDGVVDNWSGASLLPSLYGAIKNVPRKHTCIFTGFTDEEKGEIGSRYYAQRMTKKEAAATDAMVCMGTLGLAPTEVWTSHSDKLLVRALVYMAGLMKAPIEGQIVGNTNKRLLPNVSIGRGVSGVFG